MKKAASWLDETASIQSHYAEDLSLAGRPGPVVLDNRFEPTEPEPGVRPDMHALRVFGHGPNLLRRPREKPRCL